MLSEKSQRLIDEATRDRGYLYPEWRYVAEHDPDFMERYNAYYRDALSRDDGLPIKYRELVALGVLAFRGVGEGAMVNHIKRAMEHGATRSEVIGALEAAAIPGGAPTFLHGIRALIAAERA
jgi:alkylhydroperoxidase/carboxymuconolactone decarboxylase family protein YurZ